MQNKTVGYRIFTVLNCLLMSFLIVACLFPFIYMLALSFSSSKAVIAGKVLLFPVEFTLAAYHKIIQYPSFFRAYGNTIFYTVGGTSISLFLTLLFAYPLSKSFLRGRNFFMKMVIFSMFFSGGLIPNFLLVS